MRKTAFLACSGLLIAASLLCFYMWDVPSTSRTAASGLEADAVTVIDMAGRRVTIKQPVERIVLMRSFYLYDLATVLGDGIEEKLVGWDSSLQTGDRDAYSKLVERYPRLSKITVLGDALRDGVNPEAVLALKPDMVIMNTFMLERGMEGVEQLERAGLPLLYLSSDDPFRDPQQSVRLLGQVLGKEERAGEAAQFIDAELNKVLGRLANIEGPSPSIYLEAGGRPREYGNTYGYDERRQTAGWGSVMAQLRCRNIAAEFAPAMGKINPEFLIAANPDVIAIAGAHWTNTPGSLRLGYYAEATEARNLLRAFTSRPGWPDLKAVHNGRVHGIHMRFCGHVTSFAAAQQLARWLYPETFADLDPEASLREFHERFMPIEYSGTWMVNLEEK